MKLVTFSMAALAKAVDDPRGFARIVEAIPSGAAHAVGVGSGLTGLALWAEWAKHLTVFVGLIVALVALAGGAFYAAYWGFKALREFRAWRAKEPLPVKPGADGQP
jgi:hypothetical protein